MPRPIQAIIHQSALRHNLEVMRRHVPDSRIMSVVKANAYGHGIENAYAGLRASDGFALLEVDEAQRVRALGWRGPILLLEGVFDARDLELCSRLGLWHTVHCDEQIDMLAAHKTHVPHRVFLKLNAGMNRLGFTPARYRAAWSRLNALPQVEEVSFMMHFSDADRYGMDASDATAVATPLAVFQQLTQDLPGERCICNSAALLRFGQPQQMGLDWVRAGIALYGSAPDYPHRTATDWDLQPAMSLRSRIIAVQQLQPGDTVGYGSTFVAEQPMRIGVVACGYADGYPRICGTGTPVLVDGVASRTIGRVSMDMLAVDLEPARAAGRAAGYGSEVVLWGRSSHGTSLSIDTVAAHAQTVGYELMCAVAARVPVLVEELA